MSCTRMVAVEVVALVGFWYILKVEPKGYPDELDVLGEKKELRMSSEFCKSTWKDGVTEMLLTEMEKAAFGKDSVGGEVRLETYLQHRFSDIY